MGLGLFAEIIETVLSSFQLFSTGRTNLCKGSKIKGNI